MSESWGRADGRTEDAEDNARKVATIEVWDSDSGDGEEDEWGSEEDPDGEDD